MSLSLKAELEAWANALIAYDAEDFTQALELFEPISDTSRILTNIGLILATIGEHERAVDHFRRATELDSYLAIAYFQGGVSSFLLFNYEEALDQFDNAFMWLRGNQAINYEQIGLNFRLYTAEILFNRGLCLMNLGRGAEGLADLQAAQKEKATPEHDVIADAIRDQGDGYTVFSIPVGVIFRPNPNKIKNLQTKDYLGKARLISKDGSGYRAFDGVDPNELAFRPEDRVPAFKSQKVTGAGANLGRSSSDIGGTSAPKNPAGLARAATAVASVPSRPSMEDRRAPEPLARANTSIRPTRPQSPPEPLARANTSVRSARPVSPPKLRSPEPMSSPVRGLSMRRPPPSSFKATSPVEEPGQIYDSYAARPVPSADEWTERESAHSRTLSRSGTRSQANYMTRSPSQYTVRRALSRKGTMRSRSARSYEEEEGYVSGSGGGDDGDAFEVTKIRVRLHFNDSLRGMAIMPDISCDEFMDQVCSKFGKEYGDLIIKFSDDDGERVTLMDESDFELAIETTRAASLKGKEPRLEIWCETA